MVIDPFDKEIEMTPNTMSLTAQLAMRKLAKWYISAQAWELQFPLPERVSVSLQDGDYFHPVCNEMDKCLKKLGYACVVFKKDGKKITMSHFVECTNQSAV